MKKKKKERKMIRPQHFSQQGLSGKLLSTIIGRKKSNFKDEFKLKLVIT